MSAVSQPRWANAEQTLIDCILPNGDPFTAGPNDPEEHGKALYVALVAGEHGAIADYIAPPEPEPVEQPEPQPTLEQMRLALKGVGMTDDQIDALETVAKGLNG